MGFLETSAVVYTTLEITMYVRLWNCLKISCISSVIIPLAYLLTSVGTSTDASCLGEGHLQASAEFFPEGVVNQDFYTLG